MNFRPVLGEWQHHSQYVDFFPLFRTFSALLKACNIILILQTLVQDLRSFPEISETANNMGHGTVSLGQVIEIRLFTLFTILGSLLTLR